MYLGIEIGGTKLQVGVGHGDGSPLIELARYEVQPEAGAAGIRQQIEEAATALRGRHELAAIGCGFGGPVSGGRVIKSHQIAGWDGFELAGWLSEWLRLPAHVGNDCDVAGLAEALFGAGRGRQVVFYVTIGTGIGGGLVLDGHIYQGNGLAAAEIGHLRPGLDAAQPQQTIESIASGWGIAARARARLERQPGASGALAAACGGQFERLTARHVAEAAEQGDRVAMEVLGEATQAFGWAIAQMATLVSPQVVVIGGGVSLMPERLFLGPLREQVERYLFPPLVGSFEVLPAMLKEEVVVQGALAVARAAHLGRSIFC